MAVAAFVTVLAGAQAAGAGTVETAAGRTAAPDDGRPATEIHLGAPQGVAVDASGNIYIADTENHRVRRVDARGVVYSFAGSGVRGFGGDGGPATGGLLDYPTGVAVDASGNVYIADSGNSCVRRVDAATGNISTFAGLGEDGLGGEAVPATDAWFEEPTGVGVDAHGNVFIADEESNHVWRVDAATRLIAIFAGTGEESHGGDGGPPAKALLEDPSGVTVDASGNVYIADAYSNRVRRVAGGTISTFAGTGEEGYGGDGGLATDALLNGPSGVAVDASGDVYIADN